MLTLALPHALPYNRGAHFAPMEPGVAEQTQTKPIQKDRWGLKPARAGRVRGRIRNLRRHAEVSPYGELQVVAFDLFMNDDVPPIPVEMRGNSFSNEIFPEQLVEVADPDPRIRPLRTTRLDYPPAFNHVVTAFYPDEKRWLDRSERLTSLLALLGPVVLIAVLLGVYVLFIEPHG